MSRARRALLQKLIDRQNLGGSAVYYFLHRRDDSGSGAFFSSLKPGEIRRLHRGSMSWIGRSLRGSQCAQLFFVFGRATDDAVIEQIRLRLARQVDEAAKAKVVVHDRQHPKALNALAADARAALAHANTNGAIVQTRLARCGGCGNRMQVPAGDKSFICARCGRGDL